MYPVTKTTADNFKTNALQYLSILVNPVTGSSFEITSADVLAGGLEINRYSANGDSIALGSCVAAELNLRLENGDGRFDSIVFEGAQLVVSVGTPDGDNIAWIPLGYFTVDNAPRRLAVITITALDGMVQFDKEVNLSALNLPTTVKNLVTACCNECNIILSTDLDTLPNKDYSVSSVGEQENLTYRTILAWCCQIMGVCGFMDWQGHLELSWYKKDGIPESVSGEIASFVSYTEIPITTLNVPVTPYQSFNGYDHPWVGGAGVNKADWANSSSGIGTGITKTATGFDMSPMSSGQNPQVPMLLFPWSDADTAITVSFDAWATVASAKLKFDGQPDSVHTSATGFNDKSIILSTTRTRYSYSGSLVSGTTGFRWFRLNSDAEATTATIHVENIQLEFGSTATAWTPYSNICPIYPANGKNLVDLTGNFSISTNNCSVSYANEIITVNATGADAFFGVYASIGASYSINMGNKFPCTPGETLRIVTSGGLFNKNYVSFFDNTNKCIARDRVDLNSFIVPASAVYYIMRIGYQNSVSGTTYKFTLMVVHADVESDAYEPYRGITTTVNGKNFGEPIVPVGQSVVANSVTYTGNSNGSITLSGTASAYSFVQSIFVLPAGTYILSKGDYNNSNIMLQVRINSTDALLIQSTSEEMTFTLTEATQIRFRIGVGNGKNSAGTIYPMIRASSDIDSTFVPYQPPMQFFNLDENNPTQDCYGGTLDVTSGLLTVTHGVKVIDQNSSMTKTSANNFYVAEHSAERLSDYRGSMICDRLETVQSGADSTVYAKNAWITGYVKSTSYVGQNWIYWHIDGITSVADMKTLLSSNPLKVVYKLATPTTYQLTPTQVTALLGQNNIWTDSQGTINVTFPAITTITPADRYNSDIYENPVTITGVQVKGKENQALYGTDDYALNIEGNDLIRDEDCETIANGLSSLVGFSYHPFQASVLPMPYLYPLDMVAVEYKGEWYDCALTETNFVATSPTSLKGTGESAQTKSYAQINPLTNRERAIIESVKTEVNTTLNKAINNLTDFNQIISNALGLYHTNVSDGQGGFIRYLHNAPDLESSTYIVTETAQGFAWTNNGWNGGSPVWSYGVTSGGYALFKWLSAEGIDVTKASSDYRAEVTPEHFNIYYKNELVITIDATDRAIKTPRIVIPYSSTSNNMLRVGQLVWMPTTNGANAVVLGS